MIEIADPDAMRAFSRARRAEGHRVAMVPTMGFFHEGHLRLMDHAAELADQVVVSVFVNRLQFGPNEDFERYPRAIERDREAAVRRGVHCLFVPQRAAMYPTEPVVRLEPGTLADHLCGPFRPGHFAGVLTVVAKLFHLVEPDVAVFGRKDAQQARLIERMAVDLDFPTRIVVAPIVREADGLALSSRNTYLSASERAAAPALSRALDAAHRAFHEGETRAQRLLDQVRQVIANAPPLELQYAEAVDPQTLQPVNTVGADTLIAVAAFAGATRLIDNAVVGEGLAADERRASRDA